MKEHLDRNQERLTAAEREAVWNGIEAGAARAGKARRRVRLFLPLGLGAAAAAAVIVLSLSYSPREASVLRIAAESGERAADLAKGEADVAASGNAAIEGTGAVPGERGEPAEAGESVEPGAVAEEGGPAEAGSPAEAGVPAEASGPAEAGGPVPPVGIAVLDESVVRESALAQAGTTGSGSRSVRVPDAQVDRPAESNGISGPPRDATRPGAALPRSLSGAVGSAGPVSRNQPAPVTSPVPEAEAFAGPDFRSMESSDAQPRDLSGHDAARLARDVSAPRGSGTSEHPQTEGVLNLKPATGTIGGKVTDTQDGPLAYVNVLVIGTEKGAFTRDDGTFEIRNVPPGAYTLEASLIGFVRERLENVLVQKEKTTSVRFELEPYVSGILGEVQIQARRETQGSARPNVPPSPGNAPRQSKIIASAPNGRSLSESAKGGGQIHLRGGRGALDMSGQAYTSPPPVIPNTGGTHLPNDEPYDAMYFEHYGVNPFVATEEDPLSTFAVDVDNGSFTIARRFIELGNLPDKDAVRVEEFVNYFPQGYGSFDDVDFRIYADGAPSPFGPGYHLIRIGIKGREVSDRERKPAHLVFVIDVSGSMAREDRLEVVKEALHLLVNQLRPEDEIGLVIYGSSGQVLLEPTSLGGARDFRPVGRNDRPSEQDDWEPSTEGRDRILSAIDRLQSGGSTNAEEGLLLAYDMARRAYTPGEINRIILCSDGVANVGRTGPESILNVVRTEADRGIQLTTIGFGMGNYNDVLMERLADRGDGSYYYVDNLKEARRVFVENLTGTLQVIAKDAKVQVEFDPARVVRYRLIGFENRDVADRDFRNDRIDAGEIGAGHEVTALYEVKMAEKGGDGPLGVVRFRYQRPDRGSPAHDTDGAGSVREIESVLDSRQISPRVADASPYLQLDAAVAEFAEILRRSYWAKESRFEDVLPMAREAARRLRNTPSAAPAGDDDGWSRRGPREGGAPGERYRFSAAGEAEDFVRLLESAVPMQARLAEPGSRPDEP